MNIELKSEAVFIPKENLTIEKINAAKNAEFRIVNKKLVLVQNGQTVGRFVPTTINAEIYGNRVIFYTYSQKNGKEIVLEANATKEQYIEVKKMLSIHNSSANYKSPLQLNFSTTCQESLLTSDKETNLRGFLNCFIVLSLITYSRLILVNIGTYKTLFLDSVCSSVVTLC